MIDHFLWVIQAHETSYPDMILRQCCFHFVKAEFVQQYNIRMALLSKAATH
jgi:hypothetical protein